MVGGGREVEWREGDGVEGGGGGVCLCFCERLANEDVMGLALESAAATTTWWVLGCEAPMECVCVWRGW